MNKLKEINGKYYQEAEVVMLATEKSLKIGDLGLSANNILWNIKESNFKEADVLYECLPQHLYLLSNEQIKDDDWCIFMYDLVPKYGVCKGRNIQDKSLAKKIVATTDTSLELPQPSKSFIQAFIKAYNEGKPITKVLVEYWAHTEEDLQLKVNSSNEITIKKVKDSWTQQEVDDLLDRNTCQITALMLKKFKGYKSREEVIELLSKHFVQAGSKIGLGQNVTKFTKTWIEENL